MKVHVHYYYIALLHIYILYSTGHVHNVCNNVVYVWTAHGMKMRYVQWPVDVDAVLSARAALRLRLRRPRDAQRPAGMRTCDRTPH